MTSRRAFLHASGASALALFAGCTPLRPVAVDGLPDGVIDIHAHIFNGRDIPVSGFLSQVFLPSLVPPVAEGSLDGLIRLLKIILLSHTPTAREELDQIGGPVRTREDLRAQDKARVTEGLAKFEQEVIAAQGRAAAGLEAASPANASDASLLSDLYSLSGKTAAAPSTGLETTGAAPVSPMASSIADQAFAATPVTESVPRIFGTGANRSTLFSTLRWVGVLTRARRDILVELKALYGKTGEVGLFSPSIVDFELWLRADEGRKFAPSPIRDQIEVMGRIARNERDVILLNFAPFCPLRAALDRKAGRDPLATAKFALKNGFAGIKLYPPMGFKPLGNDPDALFGVRPRQKVNGAKIDAELRNLYAWCAANDVPIKSHGANSLAAQTCSGAKASPAFWEDIIRDADFAGLRVNIAHFGGFDVTFDPVPDCPPETEVWENIGARLASQYSGLFLDVGYWAEVTSMSTGSKRAIITRIRALLGQYPALADQIMYGSDWSMIGQLEGHENYLGDVTWAFGRTGLPLPKVMRANAMRYLGLDREGAHWTRLSRHFAGHPRFDAYFNGI